MTGLPSPPALPKKSRWRRWLWIPLVLLGATPIALFLVLWLSGDEPPPDVSDLLVTPRVLKPEENAYEVLAAAAARIDASPWQAEKDLFDEMSKGKSWDTVKAVRWLAANERVWPEMERAASLPFSQGPIIKSLQDVTPNVGALRQLTYLAMVRAWALHREGKHDEAFAWMCTNLRVAHRIEESRSTLITWLVGLAMHGIVLQTIEDITRETPPSPGATRDLLRTLEETRPTVDGLADAIRAERRLLPLFFAQLERQPSSADDTYGRLLELSRRFKFLLKPNRTLRLHAEYLRGVIAVVDADWATIEARKLQPDAFAGRGLRRYNPDNGAGRVILTIMIPTVHSILEKRLRAQSLVSATEALIAARAYESETGKLPQKLSDLVPRYLPRVPLDYYDRKEIRYSTEYRAIWSVGRDNFVPTEGRPRLGTSDVCLPVAPRKP